jgi:hypothetical protein
MAIEHQRAIARFIANAGPDSSGNTTRRVRPTGREHTQDRQRNQLSAINAMNKNFWARLSGK